MHGTLSRADSQNLTTLYAYINGRASTPVKMEIVRQAHAKRLIRQEKAQAKHEKQKQKVNAERHAKRARTCADLANSDSDWMHFMDIPTIDDVRRCHQDFLSATGGAATHHATCAVCGRERLERDAKFTHFPLSKIPNGHRLRPSTPHVAHELRNGMLLECAGIIAGEGGAEDAVRICGDCKAELLEEEQEYPPDLSLANGLWVGQIPWELAILSLPEQLLVAHVYPRVFVFKLHPVNLQNVFPSANCQRAMRGNVSSYALDPGGISNMLTGRMMPRPPSILASIIAITFFGRGNLPRHKLRSLFQVRRHVVLRALQWLKLHNAYYAAIDIDYITLDTLPEDDVPEEIMGLIRQSEDVDAMEREREGYRGDDEVDVGDNGDNPADVNAASVDNPGKSLVSIMAKGMVMIDHTQRLVGFTVSHTASHIGSCGQ